MSHGAPIDGMALRAVARRRLPRFVFDFVDGGAYGEQALARNRAAFDTLCLTPRILAGNVTRSTALQLFGRRLAAPFGIAPLGMAGLIHPRIDQALAKAAQDFGVPYVLSTAATTALESIQARAPESWFQLYVGRDPTIVDDLIARADTAGVPVLVLTADVPTPGKRLRDLHNRFVLPFRPTARMAFDLLRHPRWSWRLLTGGAPRFVNLERYGAPGASAASLAQAMAAQSSARFDWNLLGEIRRRWPRPMLLKGVLHAADAKRALDAGVDGIIVSNHGGRQLDAAPAPLHVLPEIRAALGPGVPILLDGGVRTGEDIARALCCGATMTLLGRPFLYAAAALGPTTGPALLMQCLTNELDHAMGQLGCSTINDLNSALLSLPIHT
ncbi:MAG: alpha-hydroxy acid oxidase [Steroidobacteraceae bacterium]